MKSLALPLFLVFSLSVFAQEEGEPPHQKVDYNTTWFVNTPSYKTLKQGWLHFRVTHRFGDFGNDESIFHGWLGMDNATDIRVGVEYGLTDNISLGTGRSKGAGPTHGLFDLYGKMNFYEQKNNWLPSISLFAAGHFVSMKSSADSTSPASFNEFSQRLAYMSNLIIEWNVADRVHLSFHPGVHHRNFVSFFDINTLYFLSAAVNVNIMEQMNVFAEYSYIINNDRQIVLEDVFQPLALGVQIDTGGGHLFTFNMSNSEGIGALQSIPHTMSDFTEGGWRLGFSIVRTFIL